MGLDHPLKRAAFIMLWVCAILLSYIAVWPSPILRESKTFFAATENPANADRTRRRVDLSAATKDFRRDFEIMFVLATGQDLARTLSLQEVFEDLGGKFNPDAVNGTSVVLANYHVQHMRDLLQRGSPPICHQGRCLEESSVDHFLADFDKISTPIYERLITETTTTWIVVGNLKSQAQRSSILAAGCVIFLLLSVFYDTTVGRLVNWVVRGK